MRKGSYGFVSYLDLTSQRVDQRAKWLELAPRPSEVKNVLFPKIIIFDKL